ncbi:DNA repair protein RecO [Devosia sp. XJ19-1]|uniref:DNA repair protein RecO n=1 Tax=Devosia ureilytica TaxID=2952754 RepID=A0A9Q4FQX8_9HYPH|nr:DNA repair protein RecO [Devosia ureilytica]MCP8882521.1 DNA repair protein RecO [Devosia ureilytica]MCP8885592.1 DNA repair protein RecO [Devosia ureilytica]
MEWTGEALLIGVRRHGESSVIAEAMVAGRGRCVGLVRGGRSSKLAATLQPGNTVQLTWRARLEDHLGAFTMEVLQSRAAGLIADRKRLYLAQTICEHLHLLPERDPHDRLLGMALDLIDHEPDAAALARFELVLLDELGFGLDLDSCAATGVTEDLTHVSPKSGRAVSRVAAEPYRDRLLPLPSFLSARGNASPDDLRNAFRLTSHFLDMHLWSPRQIDPPATREPLIDMLTRV